MSRSLRQQLGLVTAREVESRAAGSAPAPAPAPGRSMPDELLEAGWEQQHPFVYTRSVSLAGAPHELATSSRLLMPDQCSLADCVFLDTETTGLAGAGTVVFLVGLAWIEEGQLHFHQVFLADFPGERAFLEHIRELLDPFQVYVSYNGKAFDTNMLKTRYVLSGMTIGFGFQLDLLYLARRLWRRVFENCRLTTIEHQVLSKGRSGDVPGWLVPEIYFDSLRQGSLGQLPAVFEHNEQDVLTLTRLLEVVEQLLCGDLCVPVDVGAVGELLVQCGEARGIELLARAYAEGDTEAGRRLSLHHKRAQRWTEAVALWQHMADTHRSLFAAVELSKYYEHRAGDVEAALASITPFRVIERRFTGASAETELARRERRLQAKRERASGGASTTRPAPTPGVAAASSAQS